MLTKTQISRIVGFTAFHIVQFSTCTLFAAIISKESRYGRGNNCLLSITDYKRTAQGYSFNQDSKTCSAAIGISSIAAAVSMLLLAFNLLLIYNSRVKKTKHLLISGIIAMIQFILLLSVASASADALHKTCNQFETTNVDCSVVFGNGFIEPNDEVLYVKDLSKLQMGIGCGFVACFLYFGYGLVELVLYRQQLK